MIKKVFKLTPEQYKILSEHHKKGKNKTVSENFGPTGVEGEGSLSPEAEAFYSQNPEAKADKEKKAAEEAEKEAQTNMEAPMSEDADDQTTQAVMAALQKLGITTPQATNSPAPATASKDSTASIQAQKVINPPIAPQPPSPDGPQPAPTGHEKPLKEQDPQATANIEAMVAQHLKQLGINPQAMRQASAVAPTATPATPAIGATPNPGVVPHVNPQLRQTVNTPANPQPSVMGEEGVGGTDAITSDSTAGDGVMTFVTTLSGIDCLHHNIGNALAKVIPAHLRVEEIVGSLTCHWSIQLQKTEQGLVGAHVTFDKAESSEPIKLVLLGQGDKESHGTATFNPKPFKLISNVDNTTFPMEVTNVQVDWTAKTITIS